MRIFSFIISTLITLALVFVLNHKWGSIPPLGKFLSPQQGFWQNAEPADHNFSEELKLKNLKAPVQVYFDERLVPHIFAKGEEDAYFVQGYLHAQFRLWQMEFQTMAAAGRISEILGDDPRFIRHDREQRRLGMVYGAENSLAEMEKHPDYKRVVDAYTAGVNAYINSLTESSLPVEYKLLDYKPEAWSNLKIALFLKQMSKELAGFERDLEFTNTKQVFNVEEMKRLFPQFSDSSAPIIPKGTAFEKPAIVPVKPATADSLYFGKDTIIRVQEAFKPDRNNGSNNWAVNGVKTKSGAPILCNDPHLSLTLPSIWYEMQISTPEMNVYGASFPGTPTIIIGFNDSIAFGFTNAGRDVKDYYQIRFKDNSKKEYWYNGSWQPTKLRIEEIKARGEICCYDTVAYTVFGPVMYDNSFTIDSTNHTALAVRWMAHDPSDEGLMWIRLDKAKNYHDFEEAIKVFKCPAQNMLFASASGDIAIWQQGQFPARWRGQGLYVMPGEDSSYRWQGFIPQEQNPHILNPTSGFIQSANQMPVDSAYPYFIPGHYFVPRGVTIANRLTQMQQITPQDMMLLQNDTHSSIAADAVPLLLRNLYEQNFSDKENYYLNMVKKWDYTYTPETQAPTVYQAWIDSLKSIIWKDEFAQIKGPKTLPDEQTLVEWLLRDTAMKFIDDIRTPEKETLPQQVTKAFRLAITGLNKEVNENELIWWKHKNTSIYHLLRTAVLPFARTGIEVGGWSTVINATTAIRGPSWRMIVHMTQPTEAYGVYPGGQSGNPGSRFYESFIDTWATGKYYTLWMMKENEAKDKRVKWKMTFTNA